MEIFGIALNVRTQADAVRPLGSCLTLGVSAFARRFRALICCLDFSASALAVFLSPRSKAGNSPKSYCRD